MIHVRSWEYKLARRRTYGRHQAAAPLHQVFVAGSSLGDRVEVDPGTDLVSMAACGATGAPVAPFCNGATGPWLGNWRLGVISVLQWCAHNWIYGGPGDCLVCVKAHLHVWVVYGRGRVVGPWRVAWLLCIAGELWVPALHQALAGDSQLGPSTRSTRALAGVLPASV